MSSPAPCAVRQPVAAVDNIAIANNAISIRFIIYSSLAESISAFCEWPTLYPAFNASMGSLLQQIRNATPFAFPNGM
jgi:hypothetical protein